MDITRILAAVTLIALVTAITVVLVDPTVAMGRLPDMRGAPGPIVGAGLLPVAIGAGVYWLFRRFRKTS